MSNDVIAREKRATEYIRKCRRRNIRRQRRRERNIARTAELIGRGAGVVALVMVGAAIGGWIG